MKKNKYTVIRNPLDDYDFSFFRCHAAEIGAYGIGFIIFLLISTLFVCSAEDDSGWTILRENIYIPMCCSVPLFLLGLSMTFSIRRVKKIIASGKKTDGEIISYSRIYKKYGSGSRIVHKPNYTILNVRFHDNGAQECAVGAGHKLPEKVLASTRCTVYILDNNVFVTGFDIRNKGDSQISFDLKE